MATLTVRNIDPRLKERLRVRAAERGHSMEAELRQIIQAALQAEMAPETTGLATAIQRRFAPYGGVELDVPLRLPARQPPTLE